MPCMVLGNLSFDVAHINLWTSELEWRCLYIPGIMNSQVKVSLSTGLDFRLPSSCQTEDNYNTRYISNLMWFSRDEELKRNAIDLDGVSLHYMLEWLILTFWIYQRQRGANITCSNVYACLKINNRFLIGGDTLNFKWLNYTMPIYMGKRRYCLTFQCYSELYLAVPLDSPRLYFRVQ